MGGCVRAVVWLLLAMLHPSLASAQASIAGTVKDSSGAVLEGVRVEAASPALIERVRSVVTDASGRYRIVDLRPGVYLVTFALGGFGTVTHEGIELTGSFTATVNVELAVGGFEEVVSVLGESPIVDTQSIRRQTTFGRDLLTAVPTARSWAATAVLIPGIVTQAGAAADVQITPQVTFFGGMGGRGNEGRMQVDGLNTGAALNGGGVSPYVADITNAAEVVTTTSGGLGEAEVGGPTLSIVPRSGGNTLTGSLFLAGVPKGWVGGNYSELLRAQGLATPGSLIKQWDLTGGIGGPLVVDRIWYYATARDEGLHRTIPGIFPNLNAGDPTKWEYAPDSAREARGAESFRVFSTRFTVQAAASHKFNIHWDWQIPCNGAAAIADVDACRAQPSSGAVMGALGVGGLTAITSPETAQYLNTLVQNRQFTWTATPTSRLLIDAGLGSFTHEWGPFEMPGNPTRDLIRVQELAPRNGASAGLQYRSANWAENFDNPNTWRASASYVTGRHSFKLGYVGAVLRDDIENHGNNLNLQYTFLNGRPALLTQSLRVHKTKDRVTYAAVYAQDQWTIDRMTIHGALRFDRARSYSPAQSIGPTNFLPARLSFPETAGVDSYKDLSPRGGVAYDLFGRGKTSLKFNFGKYLEPASNFNGNYSISNPVTRIALTTSRTWTDDGRRGTIAGDFIPQCDLLNPEANGECERMNSPSFGTDIRTTAAIDPAILDGWNVRPGDWQVGLSLQREVLPRVAVEAGYFRRWLTHFTITDNEALGPGDFTEFVLMAPIDARLPGGGGYMVPGLYNPTPAAFSAVASNNVTTAEKFGGLTQVYDGVLVNVSARTSWGLTLQGGINSGRTVSDRCAARSRVPELTIGAELGPTNPYCYRDPGLVTKVTGLGSYVVPGVDLLVAGTWRSDQGAPLRAVWNAPVALVSAALGRPAQVAGTTIPIDLIAPGDVWGDRVNEINLRVAKILRFGSVKTHVGVDIFNVLNSDAVLTYNQTFVSGGAWLAPQSVLTPRFVKLSAQIDFN